jgi:excisionase family DNA binding protein
VTARALPLAEASRRLRGRPGRPRKTAAHPEPPRAQAWRAPAPTPEPLPVQAPEAAVAAVWLSWPRVLDLDGAAKYLSVSVWTVRALRAAGELEALEVPGQRMLRFDRLALDRAVDAWSARATTDGEPA